MEPRAHHVLIGVFTLIVASAAILFALWQGQSYKDADLRYYVVIFNEAVRGLSQGSPVQYSGIKVGDVARLSLDPQNPNRVFARIRVSSDVPIKEDTKARLILTSITGTSVIELSGGTAASPLLASKEGQDPVIVATPSPIAQLLANSDNMMANISEVIASIRGILSSENTEKVGQIVDSLHDVSGSMVQQREQVDELLKTLTVASNEATAALRSAASLMSSADELIRNQGTRSMASLEQAAASLEATTASIDKMLARNQGAISGSLQGLNQLGPALQELRSTLAAIRSLTNRLQDAPANYLLGREKIQEFQP